MIFPISFYYYLLNFCNIFSKDKIRGENFTKIIVKIFSEEQVFSFS